MVEFFLSLLHVFLGSRIHIVMVFMCFGMRSGVCTVDIFALDVICLKRVGGWGIN